MTFEARIKLPNTGLTYNPYAGGLAYQTYSLENYLYFGKQGDTTIQPTNIDFVFEGQKDSANYKIYLLNRISGRTIGPVAIAPISDWATVKYVVSRDSIKAYINNSLIVQDTHVPFKDFRSFYFAPYSEGFRIDWIRITDSSGQVLMNQDFVESCTSLPQMQKALCAPNCRTTFASHFNSKNNSALTYQQIVDVYYKNCGIRLDPCSGSEFTNTVAPTADSLWRIWDDFRCYYRSLSNDLVNRDGASTCAQIPVKFGLLKWSSPNPGWDEIKYSTDSIRSFISNGLFNYPTSQDVQRPQGAPSIIFDRDICSVNNRFAFEQQMKNSRLQPNGQLSGSTATVLYPGQATGGLFSMVLNNSDGPNLWMRYNGKDTTIPITVPGLNDFYALRYEVTPDSIKVIYKYAGVSYILHQLKRTDNVQITTLNGFSMWLEHGFAKKVDYMRIYLSDFNTPWFEENFGDSLHLAYPNAQNLCAIPDCGSTWQSFYNQKSKSSLSLSQIATAFQTYSGYYIDPCLSANNLPTLCGSAQAITPAFVYKDPSKCADTLSLAKMKASLLYRQYKDSVRLRFDSLYNANFLSIVNNEIFTLFRPVQEYHFTLYYYDQAGNLVKTVPPQGVQKMRDSLKTALGGATLQRIMDTLYQRTIRAKASQASLPILYPLATQYRYNSLNQVLAQFTPDAGVSRFWYDSVGRLAISQNAKQFIDSKYSYTLYDWMGRVAEVGEKQNPSSPMSPNISTNPTSLLAWLNTANSTYPRSQITRTGYDLKNVPATAAARFKQQFMRGRVSFSLVQVSDASTLTVTALAKPFVPGTAYDMATFYSYDVFGNVNYLMHHYNTGPMRTAGTGENQFKIVRYTYDLISGKVNQVAYQPSYWSGGTLVRFPDRYFHRYQYDAENRLVAAYVSLDSAYWEKDAAYYYYQHGPLARTELGAIQVQGIDYAYTLQGWLKGVNSTARYRNTVNDDMGQDASGTMGLGNSLFAEDAYGFGLYYFANDYNPIGGSTLKPFTTITPVNTTYADRYRNLYNGNIAAMITNLAKPATLGNTPSYQIARLFRYDQLNRITKAASFGYFNYTSGANLVDWANASNNKAFYDETFSYDANGNIVTASRNSVNKTSPVTVSQMDNLGYVYYPGTNKLRQVTDSRPANDFGKTGVTASYFDIDNQAASNYVYDSIGNLIKDNAEGITAITWNVYGKMTGITKASGSFTYTYDPQGNRASAYNSATAKTTCYVRDAQGNVLSTYEYSGTTLKLKEMHLYGSSRLGIHNFDLTVTTMTGDPSKAVGVAIGIKRSFSRGNKFFELSNHLGNVLATVSDQKTSIANGIWVAKYQPLTINAQDYYSFGMPAPFSEYNASSTRYRYGFNGKENDNEVKGQGNQQDYGMRIYDPRLGRFLSVDPLASKYAMLTPYQFASNRPIDGIDLDGLEFFKKDNTNYRMSYQPVINASNVYAGAKNAAHNTISFVWNGTIGALFEGTKSVNNYFAGGYKEPTPSLMASFKNSSDQALEYHRQTPFKQQIRDFGEAATNLENYEALPSLFIAHTISIPKLNVPEISMQRYTAIGSTRQVGENYLKRLGGVSQKYFATEVGEGGRFVDQFVNGVAHESKVGYTTLTKDIKMQIAKDAELLSNSAETGVKKIVWNFFESPVTGKAGASKPLQEALKKAGIETQIIRNL